MENVELNIGNTKQPLYGGIQPDTIYYLALDDDLDVDDRVIWYGQEIKDQNTEEVYEACVEALEWKNHTIPIKKDMMHLRGSYYRTWTPYPLVVMTGFSIVLTLVNASYPFWMSTFGSEQNETIWVSSPVFHPPS